MNAYRSLVAMLLVTLLSGAVQAQVANKMTLNLEGAKKVITAAVAEAKKLGAPGGVIAVVDDGGNLMALERLDGTFAAGANISIGKARTAALFKKPTRAFEEIIKNGRTPMIALNDFTPLQGGVPITVADQVVGAVGVSGAASAQQDEELALAGAKALEMAGAATSVSPAGPTTYLDAAKVSAAFAQGAPLLENEEYKVHASRREKPGEAEVHLYETDVIYVLEGSATFVTGGTTVGPKTTAPGEIRGSAIQGGDTHMLKKGDVIVVPRGTPHWFKAVEAPFLYFVVKPIAKGGEGS